MSDVETAVREIALVSGRDDEVLAAFAPVGAGHARVDDPSEPHVVEGAE
jgi:hypothetical protein